MNVSRRELLAAGLALPLVGLPARRAAAATPKRLIMMITPNGNVMEHFWPGDGPWKGILEPLAPIKSKLLVMRGLDLKGAPVGGGHGPDYPNLMTACGGGSVNGPSIDQVIASALGRETRLASIELGVREFSHCSWKGPGQPIAPQTDPVRAYARIFGAAASPTAPDRQQELARLLARKRSVFDRVTAELKTLGCELGKEGRERLDAHATSMRALERRLSATLAPAATVGGGSACQPPKAPAYAAADKGNRYFLQGDATNAHFIEYGRMQLDNIVGAMACDLTRVATMQWDRSTSIMSLNFAGSSGQFHGVAHSASAGDRAKIAQAYRCFAEQYLYLVTKLDSIKEGDRTLLDNSIVLWVNEQANGVDHSRRNHAMVLAGSAGGALKLGRVIDFKGAAHAGLYVSIANALGVPIEIFGDPQHNRGPLPGLTG